MSIGSIYARAPSKEALILAVYDRAVVDIAARSEALTEDGPWEGMGPRELIVEAVREMAARCSHEQILRVFMNRSPVDAVVRARADEQIRRLAKRWEELLRRRESSLAIQSQPWRSRSPSGWRSRRGSGASQFGPDFGATGKVTDERLLDEVGRAVAAYLLER